MAASESDNLRIGMIWNSIGSLFYFGCQWLVTIFVVRLSDSYENAGYLSLAMSIANLFTPLALYRMRTYQVTDTGDEFSSGEYMGFRIETSAIAFTLCMIYTLFSCPSESIICIALYLGFKFVEQIIDVMHGVEQKFNHLEYAGRSLLARGFITLVAFASSMIFVGSLTASIAVMAFVSLIFAFSYDRPRAERFDDIKPVFSPRVFGKLSKSCFSVVISSVLAGAVMTFPKQVLGNSFGQEALGIYSSIAAPVAIVQLGASYLYSPLLGSFAKCHSEGDKRCFVSLYLRLLAAIAAIGVLATVLLQVMAPVYLPILFGGGIVKYSYLVTPMVICSLATAFYLFSSDLLLAVREFKLNTIAGVVGFIAAAPLSIILITHCGMNGVSFTGILAYGISIIISAIALIKALSTWGK